MNRLILILLSLLPLQAAIAQPDGPPPTGDPSGGPPWAGDDDALMRFVLRGGYVHQLDSNLDGGASFSVNRFYIQPGVEIRPAPKINLILSAGYSYDGYNFNGLTGLGGAADPWDDMHTLRFSAFLRWDIGEKWTVFALPTIRIAAESGADIDRALQGGGFVGFSYALSDRLSIGPGIGALTQIEDSTSVFPVLLINWRITDELALRTGRGVGASQGPGLVLDWQFTQQWALLFGGRYEKQRYRLSKSGPVPDGVGEESSIPIYGAISWRPSRNVEVSFIGGVNFAGALKLDDRSGNRIASADYDPAGFLGLVARFRF